MKDDILINSHNPLYSGAIKSAGVYLLLSQQLKQLSKSSSQVVVTKPISSEISSAKSAN